MFRKIIVGAAAAALIALGGFGSTATAHAEGPGVTDTIHIVGHTTAVVLLLGGGGGFNVDPGATCELGSDGNAPVACTLTVSNGVFTNTVCGTGVIDADITVWSGAWPGGGETISAHVHLVFTATVGTVAGSNVSQSPAEPASTLTGTDNVINDSSVAGYGYCTRGFYFAVNAVLVE